MPRSATPTRVSKAKAAALESALDSARSNPRVRRPGPKCAFAKVMDQLPPETAAKVQTALDDETNTVSELADILIAGGFDISAFSVARHRRRGQSNGCRCPR